MIDQHGLNFTPQQMAGYKGYGRGVLLGNWSEDVKVHEEKLRRMQESGPRGGPAMSGAARTSPAPADGTMRYGDTVMIVSAATRDEARLSLDTQKQLPNNRVAVTAAQPAHGQGPQARSVWTLEPAPLPRSTAAGGVNALGSSAMGDVIRFGSRVRLVNQVGGGDAGFYSLASEPLAVTNRAPGVRQPVYATLAEPNNAVFVVEASGVRAGLEAMRAEGMPISTDAELVFRHAGTGVPLGIDLRTRLVGTCGSPLEYGVACWLDRPTPGARVRTVDSDNNTWYVRYAAAGASAPQCAAESEAAAVFAGIADAVAAPGSGSVRSFALLLRGLGAAAAKGTLGVPAVTRSDLHEALDAHNATLPTRDMDIVFHALPRRPDGRIVVSDLMQAVRGVLPAAREAQVLRAFDVLTAADTDGTLQFKDLRAAYGRTQAAAGVTGTRADQAMTAFTAGWGMQPEDRVTREAFLDYYADARVGALSDAAFDALLASAWGELAPLPRRTTHVRATAPSRRVWVQHRDGSEETVTLENDGSIDAAWSDRGAIIKRLKDSGVRNIERFQLL